MRLTEGNHTALPAELILSVDTPARRQPARRFSVPPGQRDNRVFDAEGLSAVVFAIEPHPGPWTPFDPPDEP